MARTTHTPPTACPRCRSCMDCATDPLGDAVPGPGDVTICLSCGALLRFDIDPILRVMDPQEEQDVRRRCPDIGRLERAIAAVKEEHPR